MAKIDEAMFAHGGWPSQPAPLEQLLQFVAGPVWDGNLIGKQARDELAEEGLIDRARGYSFLTAKGVTLLVTLGFLRP